MKQIVLLGDSIFDNIHYVGAGGTAVSKYLAGYFDGKAEVELLAVDGSGMEDVYRQAEQVPPGSLPSAIVPAR